MAKCSTCNGTGVITTFMGGDDGDEELTCPGCGGTGDTGSSGSTKRFLGDTLGSGARMVRCPSCGTTNNARVSSCGSCGKSL